MTIIKNKIRHLLSCLILCSAPLVSAQTQADWSTIFKSFENGCQFDKRLENLLEPFSDVSDNWSDKDSKYQNLRLNHPNRVQLPKAYRDLAHPPMTLHRAEFSEDGEQFILDQTRLKLSGTYYGLPVVHISQTFQPDIPIRNRRLQLHPFVVGCTFGTGTQGVKRKISSCSKIQFDFRRIRNPASKTKTD